MIALIKQSHIKKNQLMNQTKNASENHQTYIESSFYCFLFDLNSQVINMVIIHFRMENKNSLSVIFIQ